MVKSLSDIIYRSEIRETIGSVDMGIRSLSHDSRDVHSGSLFVAIKGLRTDGHAYIDQAIAKGAAAILCETMPAKTAEGITYIRVENPAKALGLLAANFFDHPSAKLQLTGITGTNGKTTVARLLYDVFTSLGHRCGLISTIGNIINHRSSDARYTTPDPLMLNSLLREMVEEGCTHAFMEVSSHALSQYRTEGVTFAGAVFTNLTHDHLDYHHNFRNYLHAKQKLFDRLGTDAFALTNTDDKNGRVMTQNTRAGISTYGLRTAADYKGKILENSFSGLHLQVNQHEVWCRLTGKFNASNILAAYGCGRLLGKEPEELLSALSNCKPPEGRFDFFRNADNITGIIDYAHTPDALENVMKNITEARTGQEQVITVVGCGGDRDKTKRGPMAVIAATYSDKVIFTSDNPRSEDPEAIIKDMIRGLDTNPALKNKHLVIGNREEAIKAACMMASENDIILVAGKGHEKYQEMHGEKRPFDDKALVTHYLSK